MFKTSCIYLLVFTILINKTNAQDVFVKQQSTGFTITNKPYRFIGANMWYANLLGMANEKGGNRKRLLQELDFLKSQGVDNIRVLVGAQGQHKIINAINPVHPAMQLATGQYNNDVLDGMDFLLQELQKRNMHGVFFLSNNWEWSGGFLQYLNWHKIIDDSTLAKKYTWDENRDLTSKFYGCNECMEDYWNFVSMVLSHTNKLSGKKYANEPGIMAWEVANEPRPMRPYAIEGYKKFLLKTTALIKKLDNNHLLTLGVEGYMGTESIALFEAIHKDKNVDYATIHIWPKNWSWYKDSSFKKDFANVIQKTAEYIKVHEAVMMKIRKPLVVEEFGLPRDNFSFAISSTVNYRDKYYESIMQYLLKSKKENSPVAGINFWALAGFAKPAKNETPFWKEGDDLLGDPPMEEQGLNAVFASDSSTWKLVRKYEGLLKK